jgi:rhodanese-related sulfurtransferase
VSRFRLRERLKGRLQRTSGAQRPAAKPAAKPARPAPAPVEEPEEEIEVEVTGADLKSWVEGGRVPWFLDIREPHELSSGHLEGARLIPMNQVPDHIDSIPKDATVIVYCAAGVRSYGVAHWLREQGVAEAWSLVGGVGAWIDAGGAWLAPPHDSPLRLLRPTRLTPEAAARLGLDGPQAGTIQAIHDTPEGPRFTVDLSRPGGAPLRVEALAASDLSPIGYA